MRILLLTPMPPDRSAPGAMGTVLHAQLAGLAERNDVTLVTPVGPDPAEVQAARALAADVEVHAVPRHTGDGLTRWRRRGRLAGAWLRGHRPWRTVWFWEPALQGVLDRLLATRTFDVVSVEDNAMGVCRLSTDAATVFTEYEVRRPRGLDLRPGPPREWPSWAFKEADWARWPAYQRRVWTRFDRIQVFTARDAESVARIAPELTPRVRVTPFGIDLPRPSARVDEDPGSVLFVGNFSHPPNVDAAVWLAREILPPLRERLPGTRLWLAGIGAPPVVRALAGPDVDVLGYVPDVEGLIRRAAVFAAPVRTGGGMRMKVLHAMALGKAVVTTPRGSEGLVGEPPLAVGADTEGLAAAAAGLLERPGERQALGARARAFVAEHHSAYAYAQRLERTYAEAMARATPGQV